MCGITGFSFDDKNLLRKMMGSIGHRGPDGQGTYTDKNLSLGHRRLAIIDLSPKARQPMSNETKSVFLVCNGEIYNYLDLRKDLEKKGHRFYSNSDNEVIIHLYEEHGDEFISMLRGVFAFALYDSMKKKVIIARDRVGVKPLYYHFNGKDFFFSSEIKAILQQGKFQMDRTALNEFLTTQYVLAPRTFFDGISMVLPGEWIRFDLKERKMEKGLYWQLKAKVRKWRESDLLKEIEKRLEEAVRIRLMSDVPLGVYLSGGLDSSYIAALASRYTKNLKTFTVGFGHETDETVHARKVAEHLGTDHKEVIVDDVKTDILPAITWFFDSPAVDIAALPLFVMAKESRKHLKVALMGDGGDEMFGGYDRYVAMKKADYFRRIPSPARPVAKVLAKSRLPSEHYDRLKGLLQGDETISFLSYISTFTPEEKSYILGKGALNSVENISMYCNFSPFFNQGDIIQSAMVADFHTQLPNDYTMKVDKIVMANGVEPRVPFLDHRFVEFCHTIPSDLKIRKLETKYIYRKVISKALPLEIVQRKKQGFYLPTEKWMNEGLKETALQLFDRAPDILERNEIRKVIENYERSRRYYTRQFWTLFSFILFYRMYFEGGKISLNMKDYL